MNYRTSSWGLKTERDSLGLRVTAMLQENYLKFSTSGNITTSAEKLEMRCVI